MIIIIGDSNYRDVCTSLKEKMEAEVGETIVFKQASTNESLKIMLEEEIREGETPKVIIVGANLNEIATRAKGNKGRDEMVKTVVMEQNCAVNKWAQEHQESMVLLAPPFLRMDPHWMEERLKWVNFCMKDDISVYSPFNVQLGTISQVAEIDLKADKVHLLETGLAKVSATLIADMKICLKDVEKIREERMEDDNNDDIFMESSQLSELPSRTPISNRKRVRVEEAPDKSLKHGKKNRRESDRTDEVLDKISTLVQSIEEERTRTLDKLKMFEQQQVTIVTNQRETEAKLDKLADAVESDSILFATMKEDIDAGENEMLKDSVMVKRMKTSKEIPKDKKILAKFVQTEGRKLVKDIMGSDDSVKFVATLYNNNNTNANAKKQNKKPGEGEQGIEEGPTIPPFKIVFKTKEQGVRFREKAVAKAKEEGSEMGKIYFSHTQNNSTRIRTMLLWGVVDAIKKDKKKEAWVNLNLNKPNIQIKEGGKITKTLTFAGAMTEYGDKIDAKVITDTTKAARWNFGGKLERLFIILKD